MVITTKQDNMTIPVYLVKWSQGSYDDYTENNLERVYMSLELAELRKVELEESMKPSPFPFDWCTEDEFKVLLYEEKVIIQDETTYDSWLSDEYEKEEFGRAWIDTLQLDKSEWRDTQIKSILDE